VKQHSHSGRKNKHIGGVGSAPPSWRQLAPAHPAADLFPRMSADELRSLGEDIKKRGLTSPIVLWRESPEASVQVLDGISRLDAIEAHIGSIVSIQPLILAGTRFIPRCDKVVELDHTVDPYAYVASANINRRHLTVEQKLDLIAVLIKAAPDKSDRQIAGQIKASPTTVGKVRAKLERAGRVSTVDTRTDKKGVKQPAHKSPKSPLERQIEQDAEALAAAARTRESALTKAKPPTDPAVTAAPAAKLDPAATAAPVAKLDPVAKGDGAATEAATTKGDGTAIEAPADPVAITSSWSDPDWVAALTALRADIGRYRRIHDEVRQFAAVQSNNFAMMQPGPENGAASARAPVVDGRAHHHGRCAEPAR
jgi:hypothetical protein